MKRSYYDFADSELNREILAPSSKLRSITLITSPYHVGIRDVAVGAGPSHLERRGIVDAISKHGISLYVIEVQPVQDEFEGDIARSFEVIRRTSELVRQAHERGSFPIILAGNCSSSVGVMAGNSIKVRATGKEAACIWFDAHDDFNTPDTMTSGYFDSMAVAMLGNLCFKSLLATVPDYTPLDLKRLIHVGMRDVNDIERQHVKDHDLSVVWGNAEKDVDFTRRLGVYSYMQQKDVNFEREMDLYMRQKGLRSQPIMIHVDVDSLDTSEGQANRFAAPGGLLKGDLENSLALIAGEAVPLSLTIASFDPSFKGADNIAKITIQAISIFIGVLKSRERFEVLPDRNIWRAASSC